MRPSPLILLLACAACHSSAGPAVARPRTFPEEPPLVAEPIVDDAGLARALREHYTKQELTVPMRDGVKLYTTIYAPKDPSRRYPILLNRTPYGVWPYGVDNYPDASNVRVLRRVAPSAAIVRAGYLLVHQDVRGRMASEGTFVDVRPRARGPGEIDEATDAWDTVEWLLANVPLHNGRVGVWGISYPGFYAAQATIDAHPAILAVSPQAPVTDWFLGDDFHHNGAFALADAFDFYASFGKPRPVPVKQMKWGFDYDAPDAYEFFLRLGPLSNANAKYLHGQIAFWNDVMAHGTRDEFWRARDPRPHYRNAKPAVMTVGGLFDAEDLWGTLETYRAFERQSPPSAENVLVLGPWGHGGWARTDGDRLGDIAFGQKTSIYYREQIELPFFERHLRGRSLPPGPEAWVFETGRSEWHRYPSWPPSDTRTATLWLHPKGTLSAAPLTPAGAEPGFDEYLSDPAKPVPYREKLSREIEGVYMIEDQRFAARRPDVLVYQTGPLSADVTLAGPLEAALWVATSGTDADFVVKLVDVYPADVADPEPNPAGVRLGGYQQLVRAEIMRGKFRTSFADPAPFVPGEPTLVRFALPDVCHSFRPGHRIMVQIQSTWFPLFDRNPQSFVDIYQATEADYRPATIRVLRTPEHPSGLRVPLQRGSLP